MPVSCYAAAAAALSPPPPPSYSPHRPEATDLLILARVRGLRSPNRHHVAASALILVDYFSQQKPRSRLCRPPSVMLQPGDEVAYFSAVFLLVALGTRSATGASLLTAFLYVFMAMFRFPPVPADQAGRVLRPAAAVGGVPVVAHRGGRHDAPENTLAAIREVSESGFT